MGGAPRFSPWRPHPWHGLSIGPEPPRIVHAYIEITPFDLVKYEIDKDSGYLKVDRPQRTSSLPPALYGFIPRTYCGQARRRADAGRDRRRRRPARHLRDQRAADQRAPRSCSRRASSAGCRCSTAARPTTRSSPCSSNDAVWGARRRRRRPADGRWSSACVHYFATYKLLPGEPPRAVVGAVYGHDDAFAVIRAAMEDYAEPVPPG